MTPREELIALRRLAELEAKAGDAPRETQPVTTRTALGYAGETLGNVPASAGRLVSGLADVVTSPIQTAKNVGRLFKGAVQLIPGATIHEGDDQRDVARAVGKQYADRYGGMQNIADTVREDPVGSLADLSTVLGGAGAMAKVAGAGKVAGGLQKASALTNPLNAVAPVAKAVGRVAGKGISHLVGNLGTHTGGQSLEEAAKAGLSGGASQASLIANMRGKAPMTDVLEAFKANVDELGRQKAAAYRSGMAKVSGDKTILSFDGIDDELAKLSDKVTFKGQVKNAKAAEIGNKITVEIERWKNLDPTEFHTPEGLDALKQRIGGLVESIPFEEKTARMVGNGVYHAIKNEITKQAPVYAKTMKGYSDATDEIREVEKALSLGSKASVDTAMRKLQSVLRNNANTNYGNRLDLVKQLEARGGHEVMPALAGQALNTWTPRGLGNVVAGGLGLGGYALGGPALGAATLAVQSPRLMGEAALKVGQAGRMMRPVGRGLTTAARYAPAANVARPLTPEALLEELARLLSQQ